MHAKNLLFLVPSCENTWNRPEPLYSPIAQQVWVVETVTIIIGIIVCYYYVKHTVISAVNTGDPKYCRNII